MISKDSILHEMENTFVMRGGLHDGKHVKVFGVPKEINLADPIDFLAMGRPDNKKTAPNALGKSTYVLRTFEVNNGRNTVIEYVFNQQKGQSHD